MWNAAHRDKIKNMKGQLRMRRSRWNLQKRDGRRELFEDTEADDISNIMKDRSLRFREQNTSQVEFFLRKGNLYPGIW